MLTKINFLKTLFEKQVPRQDILQFLVQNDLITVTNMQELLAEHASMHPTKIAFLLKELEDAKKLSALFEWTLLPDELMKLTIITDKDKKEFIYQP